MTSAGVASAVAMAGRSSLSPADGWTISGLVRWVSASGWLVGVFAVTRLLVLVALCLLAAGALLVALALGVRSPRWRSHCLLRLGRFPGGPLILRAALGLGASAVVAGACGGGGGPPGPSAAVVPFASGSGPSSRAIVAGPGVGSGRGSRAVVREAAREAAPVLRNLAAPNGVAYAGGRRKPLPVRDGPVDPVSATTAVASTSAAFPGPVAPAQAWGQWLVRPGDSLWSIAEATAGRSDAVAAYWVRLVASNRSRLPVPDDPGLLHPGELILLPPLQADRP